MPRKGSTTACIRSSNATIRRAGFPGLEALERELSDDYQRFSRTKSLRFNLAYAEGFEALTMNAIKHLMEPDGFGPDLPPFLEMVEWHFMEELEHRTVTFDVYEHVVGDYFYRLAVGSWAQWHFTSWMRRVTRYMLKVSPQRERRTAQAAEVPAETMPALPRVSSLFPGLLRIYLPSYTPHDVTISPGIEALARKYTEMAVRAS